jgi:Protein of unknown function (DUF1822)
MKSTIGSFDSTPVDLTIPISLRDDGWQLSQQRHTKANQWQGYLNYLCLAVCLPWLSANFRGGSRDFDPAATGVRQWVAPSFWEVVDGSIVTIPQRGGYANDRRSRVCLLPHTSYDRSELRVPQEWMEIPHWIADYYWAVQIDLDAQSATIWGGASHAQIQQRGSYDGLDRTYYLDADDFQCSSSAPTRGQVSPLKPLSADRADRYLVELSRPQLAIPRLDIGTADLSDWLSLVANDSWRLELFRRRLGTVSP